MSQIERQQKPPAANLAETVARGDPLQFAFQIEAGFSHRLQEIRLAYLLEDGKACGAHQRIAVERAALVAMFETGSLRRGQQSGDRHAAADAVAERPDIPLRARRSVLEK